MLPEFGKAFGPLVDELAVMPVVGQNSVHHPVNERHVRSKIEPDVHVRVQGQLNSARVHDDEFGALELGSIHPMGYQWMGLGSVGAHHQKTVSVFDLRDRVGHCSTSECSGKTCHCGCVSETSAVIDVVGPESGPAELLKQVIVLIGASGRREEAYTVPTMLGLDCFQARHCEVERLFPRSLFEFSVSSEQRSGQTFRTVDECVGIPPLDAELTLVHGCGLQRDGSDQAAVHNFQKHLAAASAKRTGCSDKLIIHRGVVHH